VALSLGPSVIPTPARVACTLGFAALSVWGSAVHRRADRREWLALLFLLLAGSVGTVIYLNMRAGPSFGWGILPANAVREARERDYFFVLAFWSAGAWAGIGAVALARRLGRPAWAGVLVAALPVVLNWRAVDRRREPEASLPLRTASALLASAPPRAVLFLDGDNDSYPIWYLQRVRGMRTDVVPVTLPLLPAGWYRDELARRHQLVVNAGRTWEGLGATARQIVTSAHVQARPVAVSMMMSATSRRLIGDRWVIRGLVYVEDTVGQGPLLPGRPVAVDLAHTRPLADTLERWRAGRAAGPSTDPMAAYALDLLGCPARAVRAVDGPRGAALASLDSLCNLR
jgi:hypothetical protein